MNGQWEPTTTKPIGGNFAMLAPEEPEDRVRLAPGVAQPRPWTAAQAKLRAAVAEINRQRRFSALGRAA